MAMFLAFDVDNSGQLDKSELQRLCKYMNYPSTDADINRMVAAVDAGGNGTLSLEEFLAYMQDKRPRPELLYGLSHENYQ